MIDRDELIARGMARWEAQQKAFRVERATVMDRGQTEWALEFQSNDYDECKEYVETHKIDWTLLRITADPERAWKLIVEARKGA